MRKRMKAAWKEFWVSYSRILTHCKIKKIAGSSVFVFLMVSLWALSTGGGFGLIAYLALVCLAVAATCAILFPGILAFANALEEFVLPSENI